MSSSSPVRVEGEALSDTYTSYGDLYEIIWKGIKGMIIVSLLIFLIISSIYGVGLPKNDIGCLYDLLFVSSAKVNEYLREHVRVRNALLIVSSLMIDLLFVISAICWIAYAKTMRVIVVLVAFYSFRALVQTVFQLGFPEGYLWEYPGFPSLIVGYLKTNDFFFSGHVGFPVILGIEWKRHGIKGMEMICYGICLLECFIMIALRGHYSIDLISGVVFAQYVYWVTEPFVAYVDMLKEMMMMGRNKESDKTDEEQALAIDNSNDDSNDTNDSNDIDEHTPLVII